MAAGFVGVPARIRSHQPGESSPTDACARYIYLMADSYDKRAAHKELTAHLLEGPGKATQALRRAAFENKGLEAPLDALINKVAVQPIRVTDEDVNAAKGCGLSEDQIFELIICAAVGQSSRQYESALKALDQARNEGSKHAP